MNTLENTSGFQPSAPSRASIRQSAHPGLDSDRARPRQKKWYSRFVQMMKFILPAVALALVILVIAWPYLQSNDLSFRLNFAALNAGQTEDPSMVNPRFLGIDKDNQAYSITADLARKLTEKDADVELEMPKADIALEDGTWLVLTAENGIFKRLKKTLDLTGAVNLFHDSGFEFRTAKAQIDLESGTATGNVAVRGQGPFGDIYAEGFRLTEKGKTILFTGKSKLIIYRNAGRAKK
jgi:lipopolysaccharide export system protein LptC